MSLFISYFINQKFSQITWNVFQGSVIRGLKKIAHFFDKVAKIVSQPKKCQKDLQESSIWNSKKCIKNVLKKKNQKVAILLGYFSKKVKKPKS